MEVSKKVSPSHQYHLPAFRKSPAHSRVLAFAVCIMSTCEIFMLYSVHIRCLEATNSSVFNAAMQINRVVAKHTLWIIVGKAPFKTPHPFLTLFKIPKGSLQIARCICS